MNEASYILELGRGDVALIAATAHCILLKFPENEHAQSMINALIEQTDFVKRDPQEHGLGITVKKTYVSDVNTSAGIALELDEEGILGKLEEDFFWI